MSGKKSLFQLLPKAIKDIFEFAPHDPNKMWQMLPKHGYQTKDVPRIKGYRTPSPGSFKPDARVPVRETSDETFNIQHYTRDPRNIPSTEITGYNTSKGAVFVDPNVAISKHGGSHAPNVAVQRYDPTGLRSARSASWENFDKVIATKSPNHLPTAAWATMESLETMNAAMEAKGLPHALGKRYKVKEMTDNYNTVRW